ncbi:protein kinase domain-containing protein [Nostoc sphaeroides]|uniref:non-specific serine/threonine protein kinase n=1 Tax=Nostoc sphaeroides CCNUC1 TaxID=2653204 RepID=A0A5P8W0G7_9NOSO|nr:YARHG domain-containing protein [Nostoc sphaeroides]QFS46187.1 YARHG domain-containing protein [Nostoc sphaeroides CCNUC1]
MTIQLLNDRYQVIRTLGAGGFGETYLAEDTYMPSKRRCVVKQLRPIHNNPQIYQLVQERFQREAAILEELGGANDQIPALYAYFSSGGQFYLVQEWIEGDTLTGKVQTQGLFSEGDVQELFMNLLPVLDYVHSKHIVHRDIKPDNIIVRHRDGKPVLIDFGAIRESMGTVVNSQGNPTSSIVIGTPGYMPSEQAAGRPVYSSDLYSLGMTVIYLLTGRQAQQLETDFQTGEIVWRQYASHINPIMAGVIDRAIAYHPRDRYPTARAMLDTLQSIANPIPPTQPLLTQRTVVSAPPPQTLPVKPQPTPQGNSQNNILIGSLIAGGLIGASVIASQVFTKVSQSPPNQPEVTQTPVPVSSGTSPTPQVSESVNNTLSPQQVTTPTQPDTNSASSPSSFYFLADSSYSNSTKASKQVETLQAAGYSQAGMFWIPEYPNLSGKQLFEVYAALFSDRNKCIDLLKTYGQANASAYCAFASKDPNAPADRLYFKQIATTSSPAVETTITNNYSWLSQRLVTDTDLDEKDGFELDIMRNSIFANHGRRFDTPEIQDYFNKQPWYRPIYSPKAFPPKLLSKLEQQNVEYISKYQDRYGLRYFKK